MENTSYFVQLGAWNWLILAGLLGVLEIIAPGTYLMWFGTAAAIVGITALYFDMSWQLQFVMFAGVAIILLLIARQFISGANLTSDQPLLNQRAQQHVGHTYVVAEPIVNGRGKLRVGDSLWNAEGPDAPKGARMRVDSADGNTLHVESIEG